MDLVELQERHCYKPENTMRITAVVFLGLFLPSTAFAQVETSHPPADNGSTAAIAGLPDFVKIYPGAQVFHNAKDDTGWGINYRSNASVAELTHFYKDLEQRSNVPLRTETEFGMNFGDKASPGTLMVLISDKGEWRSVGLYFTLKRTNGL
jgi:hypothetical protein